jgi:hypothetical protein
VLDDRVRFPARLGNFSLRHRLQTGSGAHLACIRKIPVALSPRVERPGRKVDNSSPYSAEIENAWSYTSIPPCVAMAWCFVKHSDNFTFTLLYGLIRTGDRHVFKKFHIVMEARVSSPSSQNNSICFGPKSVKSILHPQNILT